MSISNGQVGNAPNAARHARQNTRIIPVVPKRYSRKSLDKSAVSPAGKTAQSESVPVQRVVNEEQEKQSSRVNGVLNDLPSESSVSDVQRDRKVSEHPPQAPITEIPAAVEAQAAHSRTQSDDPHRRVPPVDGAGTSNAKTHELMATGSALSAPTRSAVEMPPPSIPPTYSKETDPNVHNTAAGAAHLGRRQSFVFGGRIDSSAPSPIPLPSVGSWNSSLRPALDNHGTISPPMPTNGFAPPSSTVNGLQISHLPPPEYSSAVTHPTESSQNLRHPTPPILAGANGPRPPRVYQRGSYTQSSRSESIASCATDPHLAPHAASYTAPGQSYPAYQNGRESITIPLRPVPFSPFTPSFTPSRGTAPHEMRYTSDQDVDNALALKSHVESLCGAPDLADVIIEMPSSFNGPKQLPAHFFILSRSPRIRRQLLDTSETTKLTWGGRQCHAVRVLDDAVFRNGTLFLLAIRSLYGGSMVRREHLPNNLTSPKQVMECVLSYAAAGWYLELPEIATSGLSLASELLMIDNVEVALAFALAEQKTNGSQNGSNGQQNGHTVPEIPAPTYAPFAMEFLFAVLRFMTWPLINSFEFDSTAPELETLARIPYQLKRPDNSFHSSRPSISNPKMQSIQLGDFQLHSSINRTLSSILLSIPTFALQTLFAERAVHERLPPSVRSHLLSGIVSERERRRAAAVAVLDKLPDSEKNADYVHASRITLATAEVIEASSSDPTIVTVIAT